jgi:type I restriction enzyme S subunit
MSSKTKTTATKEEVKPALLPKLRFPEFRGAGAWKDTPIDSILEVRDERRVPTAETPLFSLTIESGITEKTDRYNREFLVRDAGNKKYKLVAPNDIVYNPSNLRWGAINYSRLSHPVVVSPIYEVLSLGDDSEHFLEFIACSVMRDEQIKRFITKGQGTLVERIAVKIEDFVSTRLPVPPSSAEQQKIAECLSSVDELMAAQARKVDALKTHKIGLMQQLFPREGETQPRLRFPEFQNAGEWERVRLDEISRVIRGSSPRPQGDPRFFGGPVPRLMVQDVTRDGKWVTPRIDSLTEEGATMSRPCPAGTLTIVCSGVVGIVSFLAVDACIHDGFLALVDIDESRADKDFLFHTLSTLRNEFERGATHGGVFTNLTTQGIKEFVINCPGIPEQQRIATCLSSLDALITAETQKHEALKTHKKGLMQQLFPSPEEVSG